jgi:hypothetical protein
MVRNLLAIFFILSGISAFGQLTFGPQTLVFKSETSAQKNQVKFVVTNTGTESQEFWWSIDRSNSPDDWAYAVCDVNQCYVEGLESCPCSIPNELGAGESFEYTMFLMSNGKQGSAKVKFNLTSDCDGDKVLQNLPIIISSEESNDNQEVEIDNSEYTVFPNPSNEYFKIMNDANISEIVISNIVGKKVKEEPHRKGEPHFISFLDKGIYLVRMLDKNQNILDVKRITVE